MELDVSEGVVTRTRAAVEQAKSPLARCSEMAANGRPCIAYLQKYYMQRRQDRLCLETTTTCREATSLVSLAGCLGRELE